MAGWRACATGAILMFALMNGATATCPTFVAWLDASKNKHGDPVSTNVLRHIRRRSFCQDPPCAGQHADNIHCSGRPI